MKCYREECDSIRDDDSLIYLYLKLRLIYCSVSYVFIINTFILYLLCSISIVAMCMCECDKKTRLDFMWAFSLEVQFRLWGIHDTSWKPIK